jgi:hypothetical protein
MTFWGQLKAMPPSRRTYGVARGRDMMLASISRGRGA